MSLPYLIHLLLVEWLNISINPSMILCIQYFSEPTCLSNSGKRQSIQLFTSRTCFHIPFSTIISRLTNDGLINLHASNIFAPSAALSIPLFLKNDVLHNQNILIGMCSRFCWNEILQMLRFRSNML